MLRQDERDNETIQGQSFAENEHDKHTNVEFVGGFGWSRSVHGHTVIAVTHTIGIIPVPFASSFRLEPKRLDSSFAENTNGTTRSETRKTTAETRSELSRK